MRVAGRAARAAAGRRVRPSRSWPVDLKGPYAIKQTRRIGGEALSGHVCTLNSDFAVTFETPPVTFQLKLKPQPVTARASAAVAMHGTWSYAYLLARAGESHDASGEYDVIEDLAARRLHLEMHGTDHVVFKGPRRPAQDRLRVRPRAHARPAVSIGPRAPRR
jgi:hypothetical protein